MKLAIAVALAAAAVVAGCERGRADGQEASAAPTAHLEIAGTSFRLGDAPFEWRGITAFRLVELVAQGREKEVAAYLDWAAAGKLTVVRVLAMAHHLFQLQPADGVRALPKLLALARERQLHVEVVVFADTAAIPVDFEGQMKAVAEIAAEYPNAVVEIANEPWHSTQDRRLHDPAFVRQLASRLPADVPVALGSAEKDDGYAAAGYATWHAPRSTADEGWGHVLELAGGADLVARWRKPVVSDEPIGAAERAVPGRRDNLPARFAAAAAVTRLAGLGATFHYEGGLHARIPTGKELECFRAWTSALDAVAAAGPGGTFLRGKDTETILSAGQVRALFGRVREQEALVIGIDPAPGAKGTWAPGWSAAGERRFPGLVVWQGRR